jgi:hypothetical protein
MNGQFSNLDEFWPFYLAQHLNPTNRRLHFAGTTSGLALVAAAIVFNSSALLIAAPAAGYWLSWIGHFFFERNAPATFKHPLLSLRADLRMYRLMWSGGLDEEIRKRTAGIRAFRER